LIDQHLAGWRVLHQAGGHIDRIAEGAVRAAIDAATGSGAGQALADADLHIPDKVHLL
jgi:hypothetical protein